MAILALMGNIFMYDPRGRSLKTFFGVNLLALYCKLHLLTAMQQILLMLVKWSSLHKSVSKFTQKKFYEVDPRCKQCKKVL
jgi:hypothetical protein